MVKDSWRLEGWHMAAQTLIKPDTIAISARATISQNQRGKPARKRDRERQRHRERERKRQRERERVCKYL